MLSASQIEEAVERSLRYWFPTYLAEMQRVLGLRVGVFPTPQNYTSRNSFDAVAGELTPKIVVISTGIDGEPLKNASSYRAMWRVGIGVAVGAKTEEVCNMHLKAYATAIRGIMVHKPQTLADNGLHGVNEVLWVGESYDDIDIPDQHRLYKGGSLWFNIDVNAVIARRGGPPVPDLAPGDLGEVATVDVDVINVGWQEEV